jgi:hypothetical protein
LAKALEKLGAYSKKLPMDANPSTAHMFIVNPLTGGGIASLFSTHPPLEERIAKLRGERIFRHLKPVLKIQVVVEKNARYERSGKSDVG